MLASGQSRAGEQAATAPASPAPPWSLAAVAVLAVGSLATVLHFGRGLLFYLDDWDFVLRRRDLSLDALLEPHQGHLSLVPVAIYQAFFRVFGITDYAPYRVLVAGAHVVAILLAFAYLRRRVAVGFAVVATAVLLFFGSAWQDLLWGFQIGFVLSVAAGIGAFLLVDSARPRAQVGAMVCVAIALASSSIGVAVALGLAVDRALRRDWKRWWVVGAPAALYIVWYVAYGDSIVEVRERWDLVGVRPWEGVLFAVEDARATLGALVGAGSVVGQVLLIALAVLVVLGWRRADAGRRPRVIAFTVILVSYWLLLGISREGIASSQASRYLYPGAIFVVLLLAECLRGVRLPSVALVALVVVGAWSLAWNIDAFAPGRERLLSSAHHTRIVLGVLAIGVRGVDAAERAPLPHSVRRWAAAFADLGSPGADGAEIAAAPEKDRRRADAGLVATLGLKLAKPGEVGGAAPSVTRGASGTPDGAGCVLLRSTPSPAGVELAVHTPALRIEALGGPVRLRLRHFADGYFTGDAAWATVHTGETRGVQLPEIANGRWTVGISTAARTRLCGVGSHRTPSRKAG